MSACTGEPRPAVSPATHHPLEGGAVLSQVPGKGIPRLCKQGMATESWTSGCSRTTVQSEGPASVNGVFLQEDTGLDDKVWEWRKSAVWHCKGRALGKVSLIIYHNLW